LPANMTPKEIREAMVKEIDSEVKGLDELQSELNKRIFALSDEYKKTKFSFDKDLIAEYNKKAQALQKEKKAIDNIKKKASDKAKKYLTFNKDGFDFDFSIESFMGIKENTKNQIMNKIKGISQYINPNIMDNKDLKLIYRGGRAGALGDIMFIKQNAPINTIAHELGHVIEHKSKTIHNKVSQFFTKRTEADNIEQLSIITGNKSYGRSEVAKKDKFIDAYMGRIYQGKPNTEILSMGLQMLVDDPYTLATKDPEYFDLIIGILHGIE